jgi:anaerobic sulfite reductase subunit C
MSAPTSSIDYAALKSGGIIMQKDDDFFAIRLRLPGGLIPADLLPKIAQVARKYGRNEVRLTARAGIEIPWIKFRDIEAARKELANAGLALGPCGPRFRTVTACPGLPVCRRALADSQSFARQIDRKFSGQQLPHKFKVTVSACPNGWLKANGERDRLLRERRARAAEGCLHGMRTMRGYLQGKSPCLARRKAAAR